MSALKFISKSYQPISLSEMSDVKLMNRVDTKFVCSYDLLSFILFENNTHYKILEINDQRILPYQTVYYDTTDFRMYTDHQNGKLNRFKIRQREYLISGLNFLEVKFKNNKGRTLKSRIESVNKEHYFQNNENQFVTHHTPFNPFELEPKVWNNFNRITLVGQDERITVDLDLCFRNKNNYSVEYCEIAIIEIKQRIRNSQTHMMKTLKNNGVRPGSISKYCVGACSLYNHLKYNRIKPKLLSINKLSA